jgi:hypothetical protein
MVGLRLLGGLSLALLLLSAGAQAQPSPLNYGTATGWDVDAWTSITHTCGQTDFENGSRSFQAGMEAVSFALVAFDWGALPPPPPGIPRGEVRSVDLVAEAGGDGAGVPRTLFAGREILLVQDSTAFSGAPASNHVFRSYRSDDRASTDTFTFRAGASSSIAATAFAVLDGIPSKSAQAEEHGEFSCSSLPWYDWWADEEEGDCADEGSCAACIEDVDPNPWPPAPKVCIPRDCDGSPGQPWECCDEFEEHMEPECEGTPWGFSLCDGRMAADDCLGNYLAVLGVIREKACQADGPDLDPGNSRHVRFVIVHGERVDPRSCSHA